MPRHERSRHHDADTDYSSHRRSSRRHSSRQASSPDQDSTRDKYYPPSSSNMGAPSRRSTSSRGANADGNGNGSNSGGSGRTSRASSIMLNLFGIGKRREREHSETRSSTSRSVPVVEDVYLQPSAPNYIRNNTGWENVPAPPYDAAPGVPTTGQAPAGAPYALSNIPAQVYLLQPQQSVCNTPPMGFGKENNPSFTSNQSTPPVASQAQFMPSYYTYPPPQAYLQQAGVPPMPMGMPVQGFPQAPNTNATSQASMYNEGSRRHRRGSSSSRSSSCSSVDLGRREGGSVRTKHRSRHSTTASHTSHRRRSSPHHSYSRHRSHRSRPQSIPRRVNAHLCSGCGRARSQKFHDSNPFEKGKRTLINYCLKCRNIFDLNSGEEAVESDRETVSVQIKAKDTKHHDMREKKKSSREIHKPQTSEKIMPVMEEAIRALPRSYAVPIMAESRAATKEPRRGQRQVTVPRPKPLSMKHTKSRESIKSSLTQPPRKVSTSSLKKTRGYQPPTVESVVDSEDEAPTPRFQSNTAYHWDSNSDEEGLSAIKKDLEKKISKKSPTINSQPEAPRARHKDQPEKQDSPIQPKVHFEKPSKSDLDIEEEEEQEEVTVCPTSPTVEKKRDFSASFPPPFPPTTPLAPKSIRRCASDHVNFEQYRKRHGLQEVNDENQVPGFTNTPWCCDHAGTPDTFFRQRVRDGRDAFSSPLKPVGHDMYGGLPYSPTMPMPGSAYVPRTFSVHTVSPSLESEKLYQPESSKENQEQQEKPPSPKPPTLVEEHISRSASPAMSDITEEIPSSDLHRSECTSPFEDMDNDENLDPVAALGEGIPPYNFDLFSGGADDNNPTSAFQSMPVPKIPTDYAPYNDAGAGSSFESSGSFYDQYSTYGYTDNAYGTDFGGFGHSFEDDPVVPNFDFGLFSDVTNRWSPPIPSPMDGRKASDSLTIRDKPSPKSPRRPSTIEVEEYASGDDDDAASVDSSNLARCGKRGKRSVVSKTQRLVDCEVISNPDDPEAQTSRPPLQCRASIRTVQTVY